MGIQCNNGGADEQVYTPSTFTDLSAVNITTIATVWSPASSAKRIRFMGGCISVSAAGSVLFEDNSNGNTLFRTPKLEADKPYNFDLGNGRVLSAANRVIKATLSGATITGTLYGIEH